ncbi:MAG: hypothetical protein NXH82_04865 [Rhodobacteraceae bacterium]|nr:hypothetical protein [Paracoccaceae bacterium]
MLAIYPLVAVALFRKLPLQRAIIWTLLAGYLLLPRLTEFNLPLVPDMDKETIPSLAAAAMCMFLLGHRVNWLPRSWLARGLLAGYVFGVVPTVLTNGDPIVFEILANNDPIKFITAVLPGLSVRDLFSVMAHQVIVLLPFFLARQFLSSHDGMREVLLALVVGALGYSVLALIEVRFSPQTHTIVYGFLQHSFEQLIRGGGFRPIVFLEHALWVAFFFLTAVMAAASLWRAAQETDKRRWIICVIYLFVVLMLCKSLASFAYGLALTPLVLFAPMKLQIRIALIFATVAVMYPVLRNAGLVPLEAILEQAARINPARAQSLGFRFGNEEELLDRAAQRWLFGWGEWGRNLLRDAESGEIVSVPDGRWIIVFGSFGWVGYIAEMGLLAYPLVALWRISRRMDEAALSPFAAPLALMLSITMVDMLLNAVLTPYTWLVAGVLFGYVERVRGTFPDMQPRRLFASGPAIGRSAAHRNRRRTVL